MAKKKEIVDENEVSTVGQNPVEQDGVIFVNAEKLGRAKNIFNLVSGKRAPMNQSEAELKDRWTVHFANGEVSPKDDSAVQFVYEKLGGLIRTPVEQEEHEADVEKMKAKNKKRKIEA